MREDIPPLPQNVFMAWCLVKHRDKFTFTKQQKGSREIENLISYLKTYDRLRLYKISVPQKGFLFNSGAE
jgi:hypothetical protein